MNTTSSAASKAVNQILAAFENGNLPQAIAYSTFTPPSNIPAYKWSAKNRTLAFLQNTGDARGFNQWKEAGRYVKKGSKAISILGPVLKKSNEVIEIEDPTTGETQQLDNMKCVGYHAISVFRMEDTEGEPLQYAHLETKELPLAEVAERWGLEIITGAFNGNYYGYYSSEKKEIVLASDNERTFLHELSHAAHYHIDPQAYALPKWQKEIIAELSAGALLYMMGKDGHIKSHFNYITSYAKEANISTVKACMQILDTCFKVIDSIIIEADSCSFQKAA